MRKDLKGIILYLFGIFVITLYSLDKTNLHTDFSSILISYAVLICVLSDFYEFICNKKKDIDNFKRTKIVHYTEFILGIIFIISFVYNIFL